MFRFFDPEGNLILIYDIFADLTDLVQKINESAALVADNPASIITMDPSGKNPCSKPHRFLDLCRMPEKAAALHEGAGIQYHRA